MITTRFDSPVEIVSRHHDYDDSGWVDASVQGGEVRSVHISELRADRGIQEIDEAARAAPLKPPPEVALANPPAKKRRKAKGRR
jgi:hypothetical protein